MQSQNYRFYENYYTRRTITHCLRYNKRIIDIFVDRVDQRKKKTNNSKNGNTPGPILPRNFPFCCTLRWWPSAYETDAQSSELYRVLETHSLYHVDSSSATGNPFRAPLSFNPSRSLVDPSLTSFIILLLLQNVIMNGLTTQMAFIPREYIIFHHFPSFSIIFLQLRKFAWNMRLLLFITN